MTQQVDSAALEFIRKALGLGAGGDESTQLDDGNLSQVLEISRLVNRRLIPVSTPVGYVTEGQTHVAAGVIASGVDPYNLTTVIGSYPIGPLDPRFDLWYLGTSLSVSVLTATFEEAAVLLNPVAANQFGSVDGTINNANVGLELWDTVEADLSTNMPLLAAVQPSQMSPPLLWPRGAVLVYESRQSGAGSVAITYQSYFSIAMRGLGGQGF